MKGYYIYVKNDLLDAKHVTAMRVSNKTTALWMYLWFLDKITWIDKQTELGEYLGGKPFRLEDFCIDMGTDIKTARKMLHCLIENDYIRTTRTPYGHRVYVTKAKKIFGQKSGRSLTKSGRSLPKKEQNLVGLGSKSGRSNKTIQYDNTVIDNTKRDSFAFEGASYRSWNEKRKSMFPKV